MESPFEGRLVRLRAREPDDEPLLFTFFNDSDVTRWLSMRYPVSHTQERQYIDRASDIGYGFASFAIVTKEDGRLIGGASLEDTSPENRSCVLGIAIGDKDFWDGGYGTDTMRTICRFGFEMMNLHRVQLEVFAENERARHVYQKIGFREEGCMREATWKFGRYHDMVVMGLLEGELRPED